MKFSRLDVLDRDPGLSDVLPLARKLVDRLERLENRLAPKDEQAPVVLSAERGLLDALSRRATPTVNLERQRVLHRAVDETYFRVEIEPGVGALRGTSTVDTTSLGFTFEDFPAAAITARRRTRRLRDLWPKTRVRLHLWYTSPVASTNAFTVGYSIRQAGPGMLLSATSLPVNAGITPPGPGTINDILYYTHTTTGTFAPALAVCQFTVSRQGPDANANDFRFIFAVFELEEVA